MGMIKFTMRFSIKKVSSFVTSAFLIIFIYLFLNLYKEDIYNELFVNDRFDEKSFRESDLLVREEVHYSKYVYGGYDKFTRSINGSIEEFKSKPLGERCNIFFKQFREVNPEWSFDTFGDLNFDKNIVKKSVFFREKLNNLKKTKEKSNDPNPEAITSKDNITINNEFKQRVQETKLADQKMADAVSLLRVYGQCFINNESEFQDNKQIFKELGGKFFPFLTNNLPTFQRISSSDTINAFPIFENNKYTTKNHEFDGENIIDFIHKKSNGKGIVISATTRYTRDLVKLVRVLRALNNKLPVQIVYKGDLNTKSKAAIELAASSDIDDLLDPESSDAYNLLPEIDLLNQYKGYGSTFPKQEIWFVNIQHTINRKYKYAFPGYSNKLLALLFTSFKEVLLLDADTVPLIPLENFFKTKQYKKSSTIFFKDRTLRDTNDFIETNLFTKFCPVNKESIDDLFNIPLITEKTLSNKYLTGWRHFQEAGVVGIDKGLHFLGVLMTIPLSIWKEPIRSSIWGDKEMYWLGLSMAGDENYDFNENAAASVGELTTNKGQKYYSGSQTNELCSSHPGHINEDGQLLWINSGFSYCKKNGYYRDKSRFPFSVFENEVLDKLFSNPVRIRHGIVPPDLPRLRNLGSPVNGESEEMIKESWKLRKEDMDEINNHENHEKINQITDWNPQKGWVKNAICSGYHYCAYDLVDSYEEDGKVNKGKLFKFDDELTRKYDYLGKVWITGILSTKPKDKPSKDAKLSK